MGYSELAVRLDKKLSFLVKIGVFKLSFGKMNSFIDIIPVELIIDSEGFSTKKGPIITSIRAYKEE